MPTIMGNIKKMIKARLIKAKEGKSGTRPTDNAEANAVFRFKYVLFKELLAANSELFNILADMEQKLKGSHIFGAAYIKNQVIRAMIQAFKMVKNLNVLSGNKYPGLYPVLEKINQEIKSVTAEKKEHEPPFYVIPYADILKKDSDFVGGKSANLGEIRNALSIPVPEGFAVTARAFNRFLDANNLREDILKRKNLIDVNDGRHVEHLNTLSREVTELIRSKPVPEDLMTDITHAFKTVWGDTDPSLENVRVAMRSSAIGEDGDLSFAGQYLTLLNVGFGQIGDAYKSIIASLYSARSISYRLSKGMADDDLSMAVACIRMVDSVASGVMYTRHPYNILDDHIIINAVWGLGPYAVDGIIRPDTFVIEKTGGFPILSRDISEKKVQLVCRQEAADPGDTTGSADNKPSGGKPLESIREIPVPVEKRSAPALTDDQIRQLAEYGQKLEAHYKSAQDIEWAVDPTGDIIILQSRPLKINAAPLPSAGSHTLQKRPDPIPGYRVIIEESAVASQGVGAGTAFHVKSEEDLASFPIRAVLVAHHSSPEYTVVMRQCSGIVTESGSISGHMAALAREFNVPTLMGLDAKNALKDIPNGTQITVDGYGGRVYEGVVKELLEALEKQEAAHMMGTPVHEHLEKIAALMLPLYLINPKAPEFTPAGCRTLHDIARFCHEFSYIEMFNVSDIASKQNQCSLRLSASLPIDLHIIDLGSGIISDGADDISNTCRGMVSVDQIRSVPFLALLDGMLNKNLNSPEPRPVNFSGFLSVMQEQMLSPGHVGDRFGDRSYAIIADKYLNFSSRVGYHYSVVDAYCGETINKNYISFSFKGGAADDVKRNRRVRAIALILSSFDFTVDVKEDKIDARFQKYPCPLIQDRLDILGRLLIFTRQMDMLMTTEESIQWVADNFIAGNYKLTAL